MASYGQPYGGNPNMQQPTTSPVYQIDFTAVDSGKRIASSKRRIRWRFGFTNQDALAAGETGTACRGEEHDITLIWSLTSGKRLVLADGQEVHYSNSRNHIFDFSWTMRGNHVLKVVAHASAPSNAVPGFRQYDFFVDGMSFFNMPKVYRLGLSGSAATPEPSGSLALATSSRRTGDGGNYSNYSMGGPPSRQMQPKAESIANFEAPKNRDEEQAYLAEAIKNSLVEQTNPAPPTSATSVYTSKPKHEEEDLLIDFMSEPGIPPSSTRNTSNPPQQQGPPSAATSFENTFYSQPNATQPPAPGPLPSFVMPANAPAPVPTPSAMPPNPNPQFAQAPAPIPQAPAPAPFMPTQNPPSNPPAAVVPPTPVSAAPTPTPPQPVAAPSPITVTAPSPIPMTAPSPVPPAEPTPTPQLSMAPEPAGLGSDADAAFAKFANMDQFDLVSKDTKNRDNPFDDTIVQKAPAPTLAGMKLMGNQQTEKKEVMKAADPGALVLTGNQQGNWGGYNNLGSQAPSMMNAPSMGAPAPGGYGQMGASMTNGMNQTQPMQQMGQPGYGQIPPPVAAQQYQYPSSGASVASQPMMQGQQQQQPAYGYQQPPYGQAQTQQPGYGYMQTQQQR